MNILLTFAHWSGSVMKRLEDTNGIRKYVIINIFENISGNIVAVINPTIVSNELVFGHFGMLDLDFV